jgi:hypothetical protein
MGMFIRVTNSCLATHHVQYVIPQHVCGMYGKLPEESYGRALAKLFPEACVFTSGDPLTPAVLKINGSKFTKSELALIETLPIRGTLDQFWEHLNAPRKERQTKILNKIKKAFGLTDLIMVQPDLDGGVFLRPDIWFANSVKISHRRIRSTLRKDELRFVMAGGLDYTNISLRPF